MNATAWTAGESAFLYQLLQLDTTTPMEIEQASELTEAQRAFADHARGVGFEVLEFAPPPPSTLHAPGVPVGLLERARILGDSFLASQPNLVLRLGPFDPQRTVMFNFHMDTVAQYITPLLEGDRITGRGVADSKGLGVAVLAGVRMARDCDPEAFKRMSVIIQSVAGEEGGAMGFHGTRYLAQRGFTGRLNIVCEPTAFAYFDRTTAAMTACVEVKGLGSTDDAPEEGQNATILLAVIAACFARELGPCIAAAGGKLCIAGVHTGDMHNRVYGTGKLLLNIAYPCESIGAMLEKRTEAIFQAALDEFTTAYADNRFARQTARVATEICTIRWLKRQLPVLANRDPQMEAVLEAAGIRRHQETSKQMPFTCDAMWLRNCAQYTIVLGPGDLGGNGAHTPHEFMSVSDLTRFSSQVSSLLQQFGRTLP